jgi:hypothetical protein
LSASGRPDDIAVGELNGVVRISDTPISPVSWAPAMTTTRLPDGCRPHRRRDGDHGRQDRSRQAGGRRGSLIESRRQEALLVRPRDGGRDRNPHLHLRLLNLAAIATPSRQKA